MRAIILLSTAALAACNFPVGAQNNDQAGSGATGERNFALTGFDSVGLGGSHDVIVTVGGAHSVRAEGDAEVIERLDIRVEDGGLKIGSKKGNWSSGFMRNRKPVTVYVTMPAITGAAVAGSGDMRIDKVEGREFSAAVAGSGDLTIGSIRVQEGNFSIAGSGDIRGAGSVGNVKLSIAGSGDIDLGAVESRTASVSVMGSGNVNARASETADISLMGSGDINVGGTARCSVSKRGSGDINCGG